MSNEVRYTLLKLLQNDAIAYKTAQEFVNDDATKLKAFTDAFNECHQVSSMQSKSTQAVELAENRWAVIFPAE